ncbi:MAG: hypothetical protein ACE1ZA_01905 [Pseudomonadales bacterium]
MGTIISRWRAFALSTSLFLIFAAFACGSDDAPAAPAPTQAVPDPTQSIIDMTMASYLHDMEALSNAVTRFSNPDGPGGSTEEVETISSELTGYLPFLSGLDGEQLRNVNEKYGVRMAELAQRIASLTVIAVQITGDASIATAVERIPAFAITSTSSSTTEGTNP